MSKAVILQAAREFLNFVNKSPSPYHAVHEVKSRLLAAGFRELKEADHWNIKPKDKYFVTRNQSAIIAFAVGGKYEPGNGFSIVGAHTDSPCLKVKPVSKVNKSGYLMVGVECYGGGIWHTWFDRDLTLGGRVLVKNNGKIEHRLVHIERPILRVSNIAIHLMRDHNEKFSPNKESHVCPMIATEIQSKLSEGSTDDEKSGETETQSQSDKHQPLLVQLLCEELKVKPEQLMDFDLHVADTQPGAIGGALEEFIFSPRLDNLMNSYTATVGLIDSCSGTSLDEETNVRMISLFDNEEVGSQSAQGAESSFQEYILRRLSGGGAQTAFEEAMPKSYMISADMAHAVHPNYSDKHESCHQPGLHKGVVIKINSNQRYASTAITNTILRQLASMADVPLQDFVVKNDSPCGSTIGPIMSAKLGMPTIDIGSPQLRERCGLRIRDFVVKNDSPCGSTIGPIMSAKLGMPTIDIGSPQDFVVKNDSPCGSTIGPIMSAKLGMPTIDIGSPQLSMHSIREMCCTTSVLQCTKLYKCFFEKYPEVFQSLNF